jgi:rod shape determining protein RodA
MLQKRDIVLDFLIISLSIVGVYSIFSVSVDLALTQGYFLIVAVVFYLCVPLVRLKTYNALIPFAYVFIFLSLVYLVFFGQAIRGSASWISIGPFNFQPSEFSKIIVIYVASYFLSINNTLKKQLLFLFLATVPLILLVFFQPDFGTFALLALILLGMVFLRFNNFKYILILFLTTILISISGFFMLQDYQKQRITTFFNPTADPLGAGYNVIQSKIAIGSGGMFGKGFGQNTQVTLKFLPEAHTDFIFAATAESFGFFYSFLIIILSFSLLLWVFYKYVLTRNKAFYIFFGFGVFIVYLAQVILNIGMNMGLLPVTGLPLPLISYGGSSLLTFFILFGFLQLINNEDN